MKQIIVILLAIISILFVACDKDITKDNDSPTTVNVQNPNAEAMVANGNVTLKVGGNDLSGEEIFVTIYRVLFSDVSGWPVDYEIVMQDQPETIGEEISYNLEEGTYYIWLYGNGFSGGSSNFQVIEGLNTLVQINIYLPKEDRDDITLDFNVQISPTYIMALAENSPTTVKGNETTKVAEFLIGHDWDTPQSITTLGFLMLFDNESTRFDNCFVNVNTDIFSYNSNWISLNVIYQDDKTVENQKGFNYETAIWPDLTNNWLKILPGKVAKLELYCEVAVEDNERIGVKIYNFGGTSPNGYYFVEGWPQTENITVEVEEEYSVDVSLSSDTPTGIQTPGNDKVLAKYNFVTNNPGGIYVYDWEFMVWASYGTWDNCRIERMNPGVSGWEIIIPEKTASQYEWLYFENEIYFEKSYIYQLRLVCDIDVDINPGDYVSVDLYDIQTSPEIFVNGTDTIFTVPSDDYDPVVSGSPMMFE